MKPFRKNGFSLIELIVCLILMGFIGAVAGAGIVRFTEGFLFVKDSNEMAQQGAAAMARMVKEMKTLTQIMSGNDFSLTYRARTPEKIFVIYQSGNEIRIDEDGADNILIDNVSDLLLTYYESFNDPAPVTLYTPGNTKMIEISMSLTGANNIVTTFTNRVFLRN